MTKQYGKKTLEQMKSQSEKLDLNSLLNDSWEFQWVKKDGGKLKSNNVLLFDLVIKKDLDSILKIALHSHTLLRKRVRKLEKEVYKLQHSKVGRKSVEKILKQNTSGKRKILK